MALSFGDIALAFAGGAADEYNKQEAEARKQAADIEKMKKQHKLRIAETLEVARVKENVAATQQNEQIKAMGGSESVPAMMAYLMQQGFDQKTSASMIKSGQFKSVPMREIKDSPYMNVEEILNSPNTDRVTTGRKRIAAKIKEQTAPIAIGSGDQAPGTQAPTSVDISPENREAFLDLLLKEKRVVDKVINTGTHEVLVDSEGNEISRFEITKPEGEVKTTESKDLWVSISNPDATPVRLTRKGDKYFHGSDEVDIKTMRPITEDTATGRDEKFVTKINQMKTRRARLGNLQASLDNYKQVVTEGTTGATGFAIDVGSAIGATVVGMGELLGVDPITPAEREALFKDADINMSDFIGGDTQALRGMVSQDAQQLIYSLAGILKEDGDVARTSVADVQRAAKMIKDLGATDRGIGALASLQSTIDIKKAGLFQKMYQTRGMTPEDRARAGIDLLKITIAYADSDEQRRANWDRLKNHVRVNQRTGEVVVVTSDGNLTLDQVISSEGVDGNLRPKRNVFQQ